MLGDVDLDGGAAMRTVSSDAALSARSVVEDDHEGMSRLLERPAAVLVAVSRPWFWPVSWVPAYLGTVLAGHAWLPDRADAPRARWPCWSSAR